MEYCKRELKDLGKSWFVISLAFTIAFKGLTFDFIFLKQFFIFLITVGSGFLLHELAHKFTAQKFGYKANFYSFDQMLIFALITSFFGFIFAAPGGVMINGLRNVKHNGIISLAGPLTNIFLAIISFALLFVAPNQFLIETLIGSYKINGLLAVFNLLPFGPFDGKKAFEWNKIVWGISMVISILLMVLYR